MFFECAGCLFGIFFLYLRPECCPAAAEALFDILALATYYAITQ